MSYQCAGKFEQSACHAAALHDVAGTYKERKRQQRKGIKYRVHFLRKQRRFEISHPDGCEYRQADGCTYMQGQYQTDNKHRK